MSRVQKKINPTSVRIKLLKKHISIVTLKKKLKVKDAAISMALSGKRMQLLEKINEIANSYNYKGIKK